MFTETQLFTVSVCVFVILLLMGVFALLGSSEKSGEPKPDKDFEGGLGCGLLLAAGVTVLVGAIAWFVIHFTYHP